MALVAGANSSHFGGALSIVEIVSTLFCSQIKIDKEPNKKDSIEDKTESKNNLKENLSLWWNQTVVGLQKGAINMIAVGVAIATAGVIVGAVGSTGLSTNLIIVIESIAKDNVIILLLLTIILCLLLGMGLPTTANYVVVASLMSMVLVDVGNASGYISPITFLLNLPLSSP